MDYIYIICLILLCAFLLSCGLLLVLGAHCSTKDTNTLQNDDVNIADPNYASRTVCWELTRGVIFGAETFLPRPPQPPVWAAVGNLLGMCMGDMIIRIAILTAVSTPQGVKFSIDSKTNLQHDYDSECAVVRVHSDFDWLHDRLVRNYRNEHYDGLQVPTVPPCPNFCAAGANLKFLEDNEHILAQERFECEDETRAQYKDAFDETVGAHEAFLKALAGHTVLRFDIDFHKFITKPDFDTWSLCSLSSWQSSMDPSPTDAEYMHQAQPLVDPSPADTGSIHQVQRKQCVQPLLDPPPKDYESIHQVQPLVDPAPTDNGSMCPVLLVDGQ